LSFSKDLKTFAINFGEVSDKVFRGTSIAMTKSIVERTPVDTGRARGNWFPTLGTPSTKVVESEDYPSDDAIVGRAAKTLNSHKMGQSFYLTNNLPYIQRLENGWSEQARNPNGMVEITVNEFQREVDKQANKHRR